MLILLVGNSMLDRQESMIRFAALMERELTARGHQVKLLQPAAYFGRIEFFGPGVRKWLSYIDKFLLFPRLLRSTAKNFDVVHICDHSNSIYVKHVRAYPHLVTCHDLLAIRSAMGEIPQNPTSWTGRRLQRMILKGLKAARSIVCVSAATRTDLLRISPRDPAEVSVVSLCLNYPYSPMPRDEAIARLSKLGLDTTTPFFIHVGGTVWYKNKLGVLEIFNHLRTLLAPREFNLLMLGKPLSGVLLQYIQTNNLSKIVRTQSDVADEDLRAAYSISEGLIFPSLQEGFGWPVLEAQACGCCVFTTGRPPMNEVGGSAAVYFDPADTCESATIIAQALPHSESIRQKSLENAAGFSVQSMINSYLREYERLSAGRDRNI